MEHNKKVQALVDKARSARFDAEDAILKLLPRGTKGKCLHRHSQVNPSPCEVLGLEVHTGWAGYLDVLLTETPGGGGRKRKNIVKHIHYTAFVPEPK